MILVTTDLSSSAGAPHLQDARGALSPCQGAAQGRGCSHHRSDQAVPDTAWRGHLVSQPARQGMLLGCCGKGSGGASTRSDSQWAKQSAKRVILSSLVKRKGGSSLDMKFFSLQKVSACFLSLIPPLGPSISRWGGCSPPTLPSRAQLLPQCGEKAKLGGHGEL